MLTEQVGEQDLLRYSTKESIFLRIERFSGLSFFGPSGKRSTPEIKKNQASLLNENRFVVVQPRQAGRQADGRTDGRTGDQTLTFCLDGGGVDGEVGVPGQIRRLDHVLADAARQSRQAGGLQVEGLARLHGELGAAAVSQGQAVRALRGGTQTVNVLGMHHSFTE